MGYKIITKLKTELHAKSKSAKKHFEQEVSLSALVDSSQTDLLPAMQLERRELSSLKGLKKRARKSDAAQIERVCRSIKKLKQSVPILINAAGVIINGHIVAEALRRLGARVNGTVKIPGSGKVKFPTSGSGQSGGWWRASIFGWAPAAAWFDQCGRCDWRVCSDVLGQEIGMATQTVA